MRPWLSAAAAVVLAGCAASGPPARRYVIEAEGEMWAPELARCRERCAAFMHPGETVTCDGAAARDPLDKLLGYDHVFACIVRAAEAP